MRVSAKLGAIDFDGDTVRVAIVKTGGRYPSVLEMHEERALYESPEQRHEALAGAVRTVMDRVRTRPAALVLAVSCEWTIMRLLSLPLTGGKRVNAAVPFELEPYLAFPIDDLVVDHTTLRAGGGQTTVLAVGMRRETLAEYLAILEAAEIDVDGVDIDAVGLAALWVAARGKQRGLRAALHVRQQNAILTVIRDKALAYFRMLPTGTSQVQENPKAVARDVLNSLRAFQATWNRDIEGDNGREEVAEIAVTGLQLFEEERALFENEVGMPVQFEDLLGHVKGYGKAIAKIGPEGDVPSPNAWSTAIGVAAAAAGEPYSLNFRKDDFQPAAPFRGLRSQVVVAAILAAMLLVGFGAYTYASYSRNTAEARRLGDAIWQEYAATFPEAAKTIPRGDSDTAGAQTYQRMKQEREAWYDQAGSASADMFNRATMLDLLMELSKIMPGDKIDLQEIRITPGRGGAHPAQIFIKGEASQPSAVDEVEAALRASSLVKMRSNSMVRSSHGVKESFQVSADL